MNKEIINATQLENLCPPPFQDHIAFIVVLISKFLNRSQQILDQLSLAVKDGDCDAIRELTHKLQGSADSMGAHLLADTCRELQQHCIKGAGENQLADYLEKLQVILQQTKTAYEELSWVPELEMEA